jgi:hypothetical protein
MTNQRTFRVHSEKTRLSIAKLINRYQAHARHDSDPMEISVDELRELLLTLERCEALLTQAGEMVEKQAEAANEQAQ